MIGVLLLAGCAPDATAWPVDPCRLGAALDAVRAEVTCSAAGRTFTADLAWDDASRAGGVRGDGWAGLGFYGTGSTAAGGTLSLGHRPGEIGFYGLEDELEVVVGFLPANGESAVAPYVTLSDGADRCDAVSGGGSVRLSGLPEGWADDGVWEMTFDAGSFEADPVVDTFVSPWPATCPLSPRAWASVRVSATCAGAERAAIQLQSPSGYALTLDPIGGVETVSATWTEAFYATCDGAALPNLDGSLQGEGGALRLYTPVLTVGRDPGGAWSMEATNCGTCAAWVVTVEGLPDL